MAERPLETFITLVLEHVDAELAQAHRELYPERIPEQIPLSLTLLYPWIPAEEVGDADLAKVRAFFASRPVLEFDDSALPYAEIASQFKMTENAVKKKVQRTRERFREILRERILATVDSPDEVDDEIRQLFAASSSS